MIADPALVPAQAQLARLSVARGDYASARTPMLAVLGSGLAAEEDYAIAVRIEQQLGDRAAIQSLVSQWQRRFPESAQLRAYQRVRTDDQ
jgi:Tfp pilus assembly protein PilF